MSIKFICSCGKHLRARDEMAARRSMCPRCGAPVGIPSLRPTHAGTIAATLTPQERCRLQRQSGRPEEFATEASITATLAEGAPFDAASVAPPLPKKRRIRLPRHLEAFWYQCLAYPFLCGRVLFGFAVALAILSGVTVLLIPHMPAWSEISWQTLYYASPFLLMALLVVPNVCGTVECALTSALAGEGPGAYSTGRHFGLAFQSCLRWLICFLAGPIAPAALAGYFWLYGGELNILDLLILAELCILTVAYWLLAVVASNEGRRFWHANPVRIARLVHWLRFRAILPVLVVPALLLVDGLIGLFALGELRQHPLLGGPLLLGCWTVALFGLTFAFRLLGVWCYRHSRGALPA
jgi:hypothetical protein